MPNQPNTNPQHLTEHERQNSIQHPTTFSVSMNHTTLWHTPAWHPRFYDSTQVNENLLGDTPHRQPHKSGWINKRRQNESAETNDHRWQFLSGGNVQLTWQFN